MLHAGLFGLYFVLVVMGAFAAVALVLAAAGLFGVQSQLVTQRTRTHGDREIHRGPFANVLVGRLDTAIYLFVRADSKPTIVWSLGVNW